MADKAEIESEDEEDDEAYQPKGHSLHAQKFKNKNTKPRQPTGSESKKSGYRDPKVLMVDQLWLWILNDGKSPFSSKSFMTAFNGAI
jgi:hypothetical protein